MTSFSFRGRRRARSAVSGRSCFSIRVTDTLALLDASTHRVVSLGIKDYDRHRFEPTLSSRQLVEYVVLDVDPSLAIGDATAARFGYRTAYVQVARAS